jgi:hypothetical protein
LNVRRKPPANLDAERAILGSMLRNGDCVPKVLQLVNRHSFSTDAHQRIFAAIQALSADGKPIDLVSVGEVLVTRKELLTDVPASYLAQIFEASPTGANAIHHAQIVRDYAAKRDLQQLAKEVESAAADGVPVEDIIGDAQTRLAAIAGGPEPKAVVNIVRLADVEERAVNWLWPRRIPQAAITTIDADPGLGKTFVSEDIAGRYTTGSPMPNEAEGIIRAPGNVLMMNAEDDVRCTTLPRMRRLGADMSRIFLAQEVVFAKFRRPPVLPDDIPLIAEVVQQHRIGFLTVDPLMAFLSPEVNSNNDAEVRARVMYPLRLLAEETDLAILLIRHLNKMKNETQAMYRGGGSIGIIGAARSAFLIAPHPDIEGQRVLARIKGNLCSTPEALAYSLEEVGDGVTLQWHGTVDMTADELLDRIANKPREDRAQQRDEREISKATTKVLAALDRIDPHRLGVTRRRLREHVGHGIHVSHAITQLIEEEILEEFQGLVKGGNGATQLCDLIRRRNGGNGG